MSNTIQSPFNIIRKDKFLMVIPIPKGLKSIVKKFTQKNSYVDPDTFSISVYGAVAPPVAIPSTEARYSGQSIKLSSHSRPSYPPLTINFAIDNRYSNYWFIYKWLNILNDDKLSIYDADDIVNETNIDPHTIKGLSTHTGTYSKQLQYYSTDISIFVLDEYEKRVAELKYYGAFPTSLGGLNLSYRDATQADVPVEFAYSQFDVSLIEQVESL